MRMLLFIIMILTAVTMNFANAGPVWLEGSASQVQTKLDVNKATVEQLILIKGLGQKKAESIVRYVEQHGPIIALEELTEVRGIGPKLLASLSQYLMVAK